MVNDNFCPKCGNILSDDARFCSKCGTKALYSSATRNPGTSRPGPKSPKSGKVTLTLCILFGLAGIHRFYAGRYSTGLLMLLTGGGLGVWVLLDLILIVSNKFEDRKGRYIEITDQLTESKKTLFIFGAIFSWIMIIMVSVIAVIYYLTSVLVDIVDNQLTAIKNGDYTKAYYYNSSVLRNSMTIGQFKALVDHYPPFKNNQSKSFPERKIQVFYGYLKGTLTSKEGMVLPVAYEFIKEPDGWKILNIFISPTVTEIKK